MLQKWLPGNRWCCQECWSICYFSFLLSFRHEIFHFFPVLALCHISRALGDWLSPPGCAECQTKVSISKPGGYLGQSLVQKQPVWLGSWYSLFYTLSLSIQTPGSAQCWESDSLRHCCWFERKEQWQPCEILFLCLVFVCFPEREEPSILRQHKANDCCCLALFNRKYTIRFLCSIWCSH